MRSFNTAGPVKPARHYCIPPLERLDLDHFLNLIDEEKYFALYAPRQSGKTSTLLASRDHLNAEGVFRCVYASFECGQSAREDVQQAMEAVLGELASGARAALGDLFLYEAWPEILANRGPHTALKEALTLWAEADEKPLVLLIDEIDALVGNSLISVLRQIRSGYVLRPKSFPQCVVLCGLRDIRDYRMESGGSPFNIKAESLRLGDFSSNEVTMLLGQHTTETGQALSSDALETVWSQSQGQPWLVNALAYEACFNNKSGRDRTRRVSADEIAEAQERTILRRETHLDQLTDKLSEERVRRVIEPLLSGGDHRDFSARDLEYVRDLGLLARNGPPHVANPMYAEAIPRELTYGLQSKLVQETAWYTDASGGLNLSKLLAAFQAFFRAFGALDRGAAIPGSRATVTAAGFHTAGGEQRRARRAGVRHGTGRTDLMVFWPQGSTTSKFVIECKIRHRGLERTVADGLEQTASYMERCTAEAGHLVIFDCHAGRGWDEKIFHRRVASKTGVEIEVWGM